MTPMGGRKGAYETGLIPGRPDLVTTPLTRSLAQQSVDRLSKWGNVVLDRLVGDTAMLLIETV